MHSFRFLSFVAWRLPSEQTGHRRRHHRPPDRLASFVTGRVAWKNGFGALFSGLRDERPVPGIVVTFPILVGEKTIQVQIDEHAPVDNFDPLLSPKESSIFSFFSWAHSWFMHWVRTFDLGNITLMTIFGYPKPRCWEDERRCASSKSSRCLNAAFRYLGQDLLLFGMEKDGRSVLASRITILFRSRLDYERSRMAPAGADNLAWNYQIESPQLRCDRSP